MNKFKRFINRRFTAAGAFGLAIGIGAAVLAGPAGHAALADNSPPPASVNRAAPIVFRPPTLGYSQKVPLLIALHGGGETPADMQITTGLDRVAARNGFVVAYLDSDVNPPWRDPADITYISSMITRLTASENIDPARVYVAGFSLGGYATFRSGCLLSKQIAGIAAVSQVMAPFSNRPCNISRPITELSIVGSLEKFPVHQTAGHPVSADQTAAMWRQLDTCPPQSPQTTTVGPTIQQTWTNCQNGTAVGEYVVQGGHHGWPQVVTSRLSNPDYDYNASAALWAFLSAHQAAPLTPDATFGSILVKHTRHSRWVVIRFSLAERVQVRVTLTQLHHRPVTKTFALAVRSPTARFSVPRSASAGSGTLKIVLWDVYKRTITIRQRIQLPKLTLH